MSQDKFRLLARLAAAASHDNNTRNAAMVDNANWGVNCFPGRTRMMESRLLHEVKYDYLIHAEAALVASCASRGGAMDGRTVYALWAACPACAHLLAHARIKELVIPRATYEATPQRWKAKVNLGLDLLTESRVDITFFDGEDDGTTMLLGGKEVPVFMPSTTQLKEKQ